MDDPRRHGPESTCTNGNHRTRIVDPRSRSFETPPQLLATTWGSEPWFPVAQIDAGKAKSRVEDGREEERRGMKRERQG
jgi:hypothetical protein